jgi:hypothetical protein
MSLAGHPIAQQIRFLDMLDLARTADFYERIVGRGHRRVIQATSRD